MANLNKVMLIGRLTRDPEVRAFANGGKVAMFGFAVNNWKKNQTTSQSEEDPVFVDVDAFNREFRKLADLCEQYLRKGHQAYIEGRLKLDQWTDKDGQKRQKLKVVMEDLQFLEPRAAGANEESGLNRPARGMGAAAPARRPEPSAGGPEPSAGGYDQEPEPDVATRGTAAEDDIPF
jgi:single-strand DNA-binding protein